MSVKASQILSLKPLPYSNTNGRERHDNFFSILGTLFLQNFSMNAIAYMPVQ